MTREEFINDVTNMDELFDFCCEIGEEEFFDDYYTDVGIEDYINECYLDFLYQNFDWRDVLYHLRDLENALHYHSWFYTGNGCIDGIDIAGDHFDEFKHNVLSYCDDYMIFDNDEETDEDITDTHDRENLFVFEEYEIPEQDEIIEEEIPLIEVMNDSLKVQAIKPVKCNGFEYDDEPVILF